MDREQIIQMAMDCDSMMVLEMREMDAKDEFLVEFAAAIRAATKEEDARICEEISRYAADTAHKGGTNFVCSGSTWMAMSAEVAKCVSAIRASK